jgi:hypothetical protein
MAGATAGHGAHALQHIAPPGTRIMAGARGSDERCDETSKSYHSISRRSLPCGSSAALKGRSQGTLGLWRNELPLGTQLLC